MSENEKMDFLEDGVIIDMYFARNEDAIVESEKKYGSYLIAVAYNILTFNFNC